jgi:hypothetical protein
MSLFDLLFLAVALASILTLLTIFGLAVTGLGNRAWKLLKIFLVCVVCYLVIAVASPIFVSRRVVVLGEPLCFDDWCIAIDHVTSSTSPPAVSYEVTYRIFSQARRIVQREKNLALYLVDSTGRRFDPLKEESDVPLDTQLGPGDSVTARRKFDVPPDAKGLGLVIAHEGGFPISWFIIGAGPFQKAPVLWLTGLDTAAPPPNSPDSQLQPARGCHVAQLSASGISESSTGGI